VLSQDLKLLTAENAQSDLRLLTAEKCLVRLSQELFAEAESPRSGALMPCEK
jgi:hypothetical protein